jgi:hypothetical protein
MGRTTGNRKQKSPIITLIGEGITEQYYFSHIRDLYSYRYTIKPYYFGTTSLKDMDRKISEVIEGGGIAVCVFDADVSQRIAAEKEKLQTLKKKYAAKKNVILCDSLPSVEYWFLLHYLNTNQHFSDAKSIERKLRTYIAQFTKTAVFLEKQKWVADLCSENKLELAISRAREFGMDGQAYSNIFKAFDKFRQ